MISHLRLFRLLYRQDEKKTSLNALMIHFLIRSLAPVSVFITLLSPGISFAFRDLGIPVREAICWGVYSGPGKTGNRDTLYLSFGQYNAPLFLLGVNPDTGETRQFNGPLSSEMGSWGFTVDHENRIYLGSYYHAHLLRFDPGRKRGRTSDSRVEKGNRLSAVSRRPLTERSGEELILGNLFSMTPRPGRAKISGPWTRISSIVIRPQARMV